jgi:hypothetical protein
MAVFIISDAPDFNKTLLELSIASARGTLIFSRFPQLRMRRCFFSRSKRLKMKAFGNRIFKYPADFGQDRQ